MLSWSIPFGTRWLTSPFPDINLKCVRQKNDRCLFVWCLLGQSSGSWDLPHPTQVIAAPWSESGASRDFLPLDLPPERWWKGCWHQSEDFCCLQKKKKKARLKAVCAGLNLHSPSPFSCLSYLTGEGLVSNWWEAKVVLILLGDLLLNCIIYKQRSFFIINGIENQNHQGKLHNFY